MAFFNEIKKDFSIIPNGIFNSNLYPTEIAIIAFIASKPTGWEFSTTRIAQGINSTKDTVDKYVKKLCEKKYLTRKRKTTGKMDYYLYYPPYSYSKVEKTHIGNKPMRKKPYEEKSLCGKFPLVSNTIKESNTISFNKYSLDMFIKEVESYIDYKEYHKEFIAYWSEKNDKGKMRFQLQTTWEVGKRLGQWKSRSFNKKNKGITF